MSFLLRKIFNCGDPTPQELCDFYPSLPSGNTGVPKLVAIDNLPPPRAGHTRFVVISDTHEMHEFVNVPPGDVLVHCGDVLHADRLSISRLSRRRIRNFFQWFNKQPHPAKIVIGGNHDHEFTKLGRTAMRKIAQPAVYAEHEVVDINVPISSGGNNNNDGDALPRTKSIRFFATPWSEANSHRSPNKSFQAATWQLPPIPDEAKNGSVDILLCHQGFLTDRFHEILDTVKPRLCQMGGHVHEAHGIFTINGLPCINGSMMVGSYCREMLLRPIVVDVAV